MIEIIKNWINKYRLHLLVWVIFILYESFSIGLVFHVFGNPITYIVHYIIIIVLFYLHAHVALPWILKNKKHIFWRLPTVLFSEIGAFLLLSFYADQLLILKHILPNPQPLTLNYEYNLRTLFRELYIIGYATGYYYLITYTIEKRKTNELEKQRLNDIIYRQKSEQELTKAQNAFLKAQINPHFLFNTLDFVYHSIVELSPPAADAIITLAEMMRYAIDSDKMGEFIPLSDEIDQVENLVYLNQIRKNHKLLFELQYQEEVRRFYLIPLVLLTMVENIFKHGNLTEKNHGAIVKIYNQDGMLFIETDNLINNQIRPAGNHKGISNTEQRLKYAYGEDIVFSYKATESNHFIVRLGIPADLLMPPVSPLKALPGIDK
ncbi:hypothetical protein E2R66_13155 [Mucilaginibacter psychrotolerans]|uniref:Signal transduction histidine kinase internal region domain-containing protein n=1 Tax=Mucilaginibacter psychrotolerans TaxID=1524096 RepID=A0A4Y8SDB6_9SPHI|nr:hypothetical protein E2R66_13155 [Mucilaginibacter psychrotolerans]